MKKSLALIFILFLVIISFGFFWFMRSISSFGTKNPSTNEEIKVDYKKLEKLETLKHPGQSVTANEPGFGRENPFAPY